MAFSACDVIVVGAGAAGLMCAIECAKRGRRVLVLEHNAQIARKILISGGGRCNFTNLHAGPEHFLSANPHFAKSALARFGPRDFLKLVQRHGIPYHEKTQGQLFCDRSARDIVTLLETECAAAGVRIETRCTPAAVRAEDGFVVQTADVVWRAESLVIATGGLSIPKAGASPFGYGIARQFGLRVVPCRPALVPLTFASEVQPRYGSLAGVSLEAAVRIVGVEFRDKLLFTHRGLSGPAVLQASSYWTPGGTVEIDLAPGADVAAELRACRSQAGRMQAQTVVSRFVPKRLADLLAGPRPVASLSDRDIATIVGALHRWRVEPAGTEGYEKAEVTAGGVDTAELSSKTFEAARRKGLYFIGEVVDTTGHLGGFNFQWAWASGFAAGQYA